MKYRLRHPEKLFRTLGALVVILLAVLLLGRILGRSRDSEEEETASAGTIETFSIEKAGTENLGTTRSVSTIPLESMSNQLSTYMSAMLLSNLTNVKTSMSNYMFGNNDPLAGYDPTQYSYIVAINPYRGGQEKGYTVGNIHEKDLTLKVANYLVQYLNEHNEHKYYFFLTRESDTTMTDGSRLTTANNFSADMMITLCCNASEDELGGTIGTYYSRTEQWNSEWHNEDEEKPEYTDEELVRDALSKKLAEKLMDACAEGFDMWSRFPELMDVPMTNNDMISCIVYMGFLTYDFDLNLMTDQVHQAAAAEAMGKVILDFLSSSAPTRVPEEKPVNVDDLIDGYDPSVSVPITRPANHDESSYEDEYEDYED